MFDTSIMVEVVLDALLLATAITAHSIMVACNSAIAKVVTRLVRLSMTRAFVLDAVQSTSTCGTNASTYLSDYVWKGSNNKRAYNDDDHHEHHASSSSCVQNRT